uniref:Exosome complex component RRP45 n=1 Tax=Tabanus bromius TaxID=304241 RepID=A0A0K8TM19_TABBR
MKDAPLSTSEKNFVLQCIKQNKRLDGRKFDEFRPMEIILSSNWGGVIVCLGETKVFAQASCEVGQPKSQRPNEGLVYINVDIGPLAASNYQSGSNEVTVQVNRILEKIIKDSGCVDLESLCISSEEKVWILRVNVNILNPDGNIIDCASIAALTALLHFKRPDVTVEGEETIIHTHEERDPIPIVLHHYPISISFATFNDGEVAVADPTVIEERCSEANMIFGINSYRELCCLNLGGTTLTSTNLLLMCSNKAAHRAKFVVEKIKAVIADDANARNEGKPVGFGVAVEDGRLVAPPFERIPLKLTNLGDIQSIVLKGEFAGDIGNMENKYELPMGENTGNVKFVDDNSDSDDSIVFEDNYATSSHSGQTKTTKMETQNVNTDSDSEEEIMILENKEFV